jgi:hypothetical protein
MILFQIFIIFVSLVFVVIGLVLLRKGWREL